MEDAKLIIHNLPSEFAAADLNEIFGVYGNIIECEFKWGVGFVGYDDANSAEEAFVNLNGGLVEGKTIKIDFPGRKAPVSRLIVKNLPTASYSAGELKELFQPHGDIIECDYKWGYGFIKFKEETSVVESMKALKGTEVAAGKRLYFELQGPNGEAKGADQTPSHVETDGERSAHAKIGPVRLFLGNLKDGTTEEEVKEAIESIGEVKRIDVKGNFGFVHFKEPDACREALSVLSKISINGQCPRVQLAETKKGGKVFVGGLHEDVNQEELMNAFLEHGSIVEYKFVRQFAFFTYDETAEAKNAVTKMNGRDLCGCQIKVAISTADRAISMGDKNACHSCGAPGHISRDCPKDRKDICHKCGRSGHWARDCPDPHATGGYKYPVRSRSRSPVRGREPVGYPAPVYSRGSGVRR